MKFRQFLSVVPKPIRTLGMIVLILFVPIGTTVGFFAAKANGQLVTSLVCGLLGGTAMGIFLAIWVMCLGYVYEDAGRRMMPPVLWILVAILVPNLLGFLIYFAVRRPIAQPCAKCGQPVRANARFCSWCGHQGSV